LDGRILLITQTYVGELMGIRTPLPRGHCRPAEHGTPSPYAKRDSRLAGGSTAGRKGSSPSADAEEWALGGNRLHRAYCPLTPNPRHSTRKPGLRNPAL